MNQGEGTLLVGGRGPFYNQSWWERVDGSSSKMGGKLTQAWGQQQERKENLKNWFEPIRNN